MWLLTTCARPDMARRLIQACSATGMSQPALMFVDGDPDGYDFPLPPNWTAVVSGNIGVGPAMNWFFGEYPDEPFYGWLADDFEPRTHGWDAALARVAGTHLIAYGGDDWKRGKEPTWITSAFALGGDLVRALGWFSPPGIRQAGIDSAWNRLGRKYGLMRYCLEVTVAHLHWKNGQRQRDATDNDTLAEKPAWSDWLENRHAHAERTVEDFLRNKGFGAPGWCGPVLAEPRSRFDAGPVRPTR